MDQICTRILYRKHARLVGLVDLVFAGVLLVGVVLWFTVATTLTTAFWIDRLASSSSSGNDTFGNETTEVPKEETMNNNNYYNSSSHFLRSTIAVIADLKGKNEVFIGIRSMWTFVGIFSLTTALHIYAAARLINASDIGLGPGKAYGMALSWSNANIFTALVHVVLLIIIGTIGRAFQNILYCAAIGVIALIRAIFSYVVWRFLKSLKEAKKSAPLRK